jgi:putative tricarboxylic transport membrane protein
LGIPGDTVTAVLLGALLIQGIDPGPFFITENGDLFAQILVILVAGNICILMLGLTARRFLPSVLKIPPRMMVPIIGVLCATGGFAVNNSPFEVALIAVLGVGGYLLACFGLPMAPMVLGLVLGPIIESNLRDALTVHNMDVSVFFKRPISAALLLGIGLTIFFSWRSMTRRKKTT